MKKQLATLCIAAALSATVVFAQGMGRRGAPGTPPDPQAMVQFRVNRLAAVLNLTDAQKGQAVSIFTSAQNAAQGVHENLRTVMQSLSDAIKRNDAGAIETLAAQAGTLQGQLLAIQGKADAAFYTMLNADQQAKYDTMPGFFGPGGMGMGMGRPGAGGPAGGLGGPRGPRRGAQ
ncbi:MAG: Spy/CpxP family protein refolding chaperone [Rhodospirillales bacterium]